VIAQVLELNLHRHLRDGSDGNVLVVDSGFVMVIDGFEVGIDAGFLVIAQVLELDLLGTFEMDLTVTSRLSMPASPWW
jgi:hypothetical protein